MSPATSTDVYSDVYYDVCSFAYSDCLLRPSMISLIEALERTVTNPSSAPPRPRSRQSTGQARCAEECPRPTNSPTWCGDVAKLVIPSVPTEQLTVDGHCVFRFCGPHPVSRGHLAGHGTAWAQHGAQHEHTVGQRYPLEDTPSSGLPEQADSRIVPLTLISTILRNCLHHYGRSGRVGSGADVVCRGFILSSAMPTVY